MTSSSRYEQVPEVNGIEFVADMNGIEFFKYLKSVGNPTPVILLSRKGATKIAVEEVANATELALPKNADIRPQLAELVTLVKQTMLRKKGEREQKAQNEQLATILSATPLGIFQTRNGIIQWVNRPLALMLGYEESAARGKGCADHLAKTADEFDQSVRELQIQRDPQGFGCTRSATSPERRFTARVPDPGPDARPPRARKGRDVYCHRYLGEEEDGRCPEGERGQVPGSPAEHPEHHHPDGYAGDHHVLQHLCADLLRL